MKDKNFVIESITPFSESLIWQLNRDYYNESGISAWSDGTVPHNMTSNANVGRTYAELIFAFLKDLASKGKQKETVYIIELGAGHGRLAFHVLIHLQKLLASTNESLPPYCYILSDIVEENLSFFENHIQFQNYFEQGVLDVAYFDAIGGDNLFLRKAKKTINQTDLEQPILALANYFFDSIPNDLFYIKEQVISTCSVAINSPENPEGMKVSELMNNIELSYYNYIPQLPIYEEPVFNELLEDYKKNISDSYLNFPKQAMVCLSSIKSLSKEGLVLLTMDKGFHEIENLKDNKVPDFVNHGSVSLWVNFHALINFCSKKGGKVMFPSLSNFHLEIACLRFLNDDEDYYFIEAAYQKYVNDFGPDDFNSIKQMAYKNVANLNIIELIAFYRLSGYDSNFFIKFIPRLKQLLTNITFKERTRIVETMDIVWQSYFNINEPYDLAYEIGGLLFDLGLYTKALYYFELSIDSFGVKSDILYNQALCYYQLRQDDYFYNTVNLIKSAFPNFEMISSLENLDMK